MPSKELCRHKLSKIIKGLTLLFCIIFIGLASAGVDYAQFDYSRGLFIAILVLTCFLFLLYLIESHLQRKAGDYDVEKNKKPSDRNGKENGAFTGEDAVKASENSAGNNVKWVTNYVAYVNNDNKTDSKADDASKAKTEEGGDWRKNYVPFEQDEANDISDGDGNGDNKDNKTESEK